MRMICMLAFGGRIDADKAFHLFEKLSHRFQTEYMPFYVFFGTLLEKLTFFPPVYRLKSIVHSVLRWFRDLLLLIFIGGVFLACSCGGHDQGGHQRVP
jgi:hypothetical protein